MKAAYTRLALMLFLVLAMTVPKDLKAGVDEEEMKEKLPMMMGQSNVGKDYWFSIPPCYEDESAGHDNFVKVLITSPNNTMVTVEVPGKGYHKQKTTIANGVIEFLLTPTVAQAILHSGQRDKVEPAKVFKAAGVHVYSDDPIVVYVVVRYHWTSDGFLAIPSTAFGTEYINMVFKEPALWSNGWFNPFTAVTTPYDNTQINFTMGGGDNGNDEMPLDGGRKVKTGESASAYMMSGDVWLLSINGQLQDLSGSKFTGSKPFSIVSGVHCANFPVGNRACDYTVEMELPTYTWGKQYYVTPMKGRTYNGIVRVFASEDKTNVYRDGSYIGTIKKGGGAAMGIGYLEFRLWNMLDDFGKAIPPKIATISADKPISIMYYNTGTQEDVVSIVTDPFMMTMSPIEQFNTEMYFPSPNATGGSDPFTLNYVNLIFELHEDFMPKDLLFAEFSTTGREPNWVPVSEQFGAGFDKFVIPYKGKYYGTTTLTLGTEGVYGIKSDSTKFVAYSYGYSDWDSYGFPTAAALRDLRSADTNTPIPSYVQSCDGDVEKDMGIVTDMPNDESVRSNMADLYLIKELSENYLFDWRSTAGEFIPGQQRTLSWWLTVIDKKKYAKAVIYFTDRAGNDTTITVEYKPTEYEVTGDLHYGTLAETGTPVILKDTIRNLSTISPLYITRVELQNKNQGFSIDSYEPAGWTPPMPIAAGQEVVVNVKFDPVVALALGKRPIYKDSLGVGYGDKNFVECYFGYETLQDAYLGAPVIVVGDWDFGPLNIATTGTVTKAIQIKNDGDNALHITGISSDLTVPEFSHDFNTRFPDVSVTRPLYIEPGKTETFTASFKPTAEKAYTDQIVFQSDAKDNRDNVCILNGLGIASNVSASGANWGRYLIDRPAFGAGPYDVEATVTHKGLLVQNLGTNPLIKTRVVNVIYTENPTGAIEYFRAGGKNIFDFINANVKNKFLSAGDKIEEVVQYLPKAKGDHSVTIKLIFDEEVNGDTLVISYFGTGLVPNLSVTDVTYPIKMLIDDEANFQSGENMVITNTQDDYGYPLTVSNVTYNPATDVSTDITNFNGMPYRLDNALITNMASTPIPVGESVTIPVEFVARNLLNPVTATIISNADNTAGTYIDKSDWTGIGFNIGLDVTKDTSNVCVKASDQLALTISNTSELDIVIDRLSLQLNGVDISDLDGDGTDDIFITSIDNNLTIPKDGGVRTVNILFTPSAKIGIIDLDLNIEHQYSDLSISGADKSITVSSKSFAGSTSSNITGATASPSSNNFDKKFMISIGDAFFYEISTNTDVTNADVQRVSVNLNYNRFFVQPEFDSTDYSKIELGSNSAVIVPGTFKNNALPGGVMGSRVISFDIQSTDGTPVLSTPRTILRLPFLAVLPADSDNFDPKEVLGTKGENLGLFDMHHTVSGAECYAHTQDSIEVGIREICTGDLRLLYIGDLSGEGPTVQPNPISTNGGTIEYSVPFDRPGQIVLYDAAMKQVAVLYDGVMKQGRQTVEVPASQLANGSYYFKIEMGQEKAMGTIVIQK